MGPQGVGLLGETVNILREHFRQDGAPKKPLTEERARELAAQYNQYAYHCQICQLWHLASLEDK